MTQKHCKTILFLASEPSNAAKLRVGQELRDIQERLQLAKMRDQYSLVERMAVRPHDITQAILDIEPQIIHFSGHGTSEGELCFEDVNGKLKTVTSEALSSLFELLSKQVNCVILNCCYSESQARSIVKHIDYVVGMKKEIGDEAAIVFATGFYKALGAGRSIEDAFNFGVVELQLLGIPEHLTPVLLQKNLIRHMSVEAYDYHLHKDFASFKRDQQTVILNPKSYRSIQSLLNDLFEYYFSKLYSPYSYGKEWVLVGEKRINRKQILVPLEWIENPGVSINTLNSQWSISNLPSQQNITPGSQWKVLEKDEISQVSNNLFAIASNNTQLIEMLISNSKAMYAFIETCGTRCSLKDFDRQNYRHICVISEGYFFREDQFSGIVCDDNLEVSQRLLEDFIPLGLLHSKENSRF